MILTTLMLAVGLLAAPEPQAEPQKGWVVELRGYTYHPQAKPTGWIIEPVFPKTMQPAPPKPVRVEVIHPIYVDDLSAFFKKLKKR